MLTVGYIGLGIMGKSIARKEKPKDVTLRILWGKLRLAAPVEVTVGP